MLARIRTSMDEKEEGFTLIELLVVIIIIGILAAIAIPVFLNQRKKGVDASMKSDLRTVANELESYYAENRIYPATANITQAGTTVTVGTGGNAIRVSNGNTLTVAYNTGSSSYCILATNANNSSHNWVYVSSQGGLQGGSTVACPASY
jgi:type IV pilus assembly protein PilA